MHDPPNQLTLSYLASSNSIDFFFLAINSQQATMSMYTVEQKRDETTFTVCWPRFRKALQQKLEMVSVQGNTTAHAEI